MDLTKQVGVERELQDRAATRLASELGVVGLVVKVAEGRVRARSRRHLAKNVGVANPALAGKRALVDDVRSRRERRDCRLNTGVQRPVLRHLHDVETLVAKVLNVGALMGLAALPE